MSELKKKTLEKPFSCNYCEQTFRTRQGLSGHIQFKHPSDPLGTNKGLNFFQDVFKFKKNASTAGFNQKQISQMIEILKLWEQIKFLFETQHIKLNNTDFKNYLIVSLSQMQANQQLYNKLEKQLSQAISDMIEIQNNIITAMYDKSS